MKRIFYIWSLAIVLLGVLIPVPSTVYAAEESGSVGIEGTIPSPPPSTGATISLPTNGQIFTELPVTVRGICPDGLLVKLFKNNVFGGSAQCQNGSYAIVTDLFSGKNELVVRVYDALEQPGPDSNIVTVTFNSPTSIPGPRVSLSSNFAKRGADPGQTLEWPITLSGGSGPYAISIDWGDGKSPDLMSQAFPGTFTIKHVYDSPGVYNVVVKATDRDGVAAFLQLVGVANGQLIQAESAQSTQQTITRTEVLWLPAAVSIPLIFIAFWLGKRYAVRALRKRLEHG